MRQVKIEAKRIDNVLRRRLFEAVDAQDIDMRERCLSMFSQPVAGKLGVADQ